MLSSSDWKLTFVTNHQLSLQCPTTKYPCSANHQVSLQCPTAKYPCSALPQSIPAVPNRRVSLHCRTAKHPCSAQLQSIPAVSNHQISLRGPTEKYPCTAQPQSILGVLNSRVSIFLQRICSAARKTVEGGSETLHFLCNNGFRVGMLDFFLFLWDLQLPFGNINFWA